MPPKSQGLVRRAAVGQAIRALERTDGLIETVSAGPYPASGKEQPLHLVHEGVSLQVETQHRNPQHGDATNDDVVLSQHVVERLGRLKVVASVDLHCATEVLELGVKVCRSSRELANGLPRGLRECTSTALCREIELTERMHTVGDDTDQHVQEGRTGSATHLTPLLLELGRGDEALIGRHAQEQRRLPIARGPARASNGGPLRNHYRQTAAAGHRLADHPGLVHDSSGMDRTWRPTAPGDRDVDLLWDEVLKASGDQRSGSVKDSSLPGLEQCRPEAPTLRQLSDDDRLSAELVPPSCVHLVAYIEPIADLA